MPKTKKPKAVQRNIPSTNEIEAYLHCGKCLDELPKGVSPREWASLEVGWTKLGLQIWCKRHECNVTHINFQGQCHPANVERQLEPHELEERTKK